MLVFDTCAGHINLLSRNYFIRRQLMDTLPLKFQVQSDRMLCCFFWPVYTPRVKSNSAEDTLQAV